MLEYAANGHHYWTKDNLRTLAAQSIQGRGLTLEEALQRLGPDDGLGIEDYFDRAEGNLRPGQIRLVFFLEEAPFELKSVRRFPEQADGTYGGSSCGGEAVRELDGTTVVVPTLFGYTEEARQVKRAVVVISKQRLSQEVERGGVLRGRSHKSG